MRMQAKKGERQGPSVIRPAKLLKRETHASECNRQSLSRRKVKERRASDSHVVEKRGESAKKMTGLPHAHGGPQTAEVASRILSLDLPSLVNHEHTADRSSRPALEGSSSSKPLWPWHCEKCQRCCDRLPWSPGGEKDFSDWLAFMSSCDRFRTKTTQARKTHHSHPFPCPLLTAHFRSLHKQRNPSFDTETDPLQNQQEECSWGKHRFSLYSVFSRCYTPYRLVAPGTCTRPFPWFISLCVAKQFWNTLSTKRRENLLAQSPNHPHASPRENCLLRQDLPCCCNKHHVFLFSHPSLWLMTFDWLWSHKQDDHEVLGNKKTNPDETSSHAPDPRHSQNTWLARDCQ